MTHLVVLFHLATLFLGLALLGLLGARWRRSRSPLTFWRLFHFAGFTATMVVAALDAYAVVNLGVGNSLTQVWSSAVLAGTAAMTFSFPHPSLGTSSSPSPWPTSTPWSPRVGRRSDGPAPRAPWASPLRRATTWA